MTPIRRLATAALASLTAVALAACAPGDGDDPAPSGAVPVTVGLTYIPNVQFSAFYVGVEEGIFAEHGLDVTIRHHGAQEDAFGALLAGEEDVVFASADEAVVAAVQSPGLRTFATSFQRFPGVVIAPADAQVTSVADLAGGSIGIPGRFGSTWYATLAALHQAGLEEDDVDVTDIGFTQVAALTAGRVDAIVGYTNNETVQFGVAGFDVVELPVTDPAEPSLVGPGLVTTEGHLPDDVLADLADAMAEAERRIVEDPQLAIDATRGHVPTLADPAQLAAAEAVLAATTTLWLVDGEVSVDVDPAAFERMAAFLVEVGIIDEAPEETVIEL